MTRPRPKPAQQPPLPPDCPLEDVLVLLAGAWTAKILWFLRAGPRRYGDLRRDLGRVSTKVLTQRLRAMEANAMIRREVLAGKPPQVEYSLTPLGREFEPILDSMEQVARRLRQGVRPGLSQAESITGARPPTRLPRPGGTR